MVTVFSVNNLIYVKGKHKTHTKITPQVVCRLTTMKYFAAFLSLEKSGKFPEKNSRTDLMQNIFTLHLFYRTFLDGYLFHGMCLFRNGSNVFQVHIVFQCHI